MRDKTRQRSSVFVFVLALSACGAPHMPSAPSAPFPEPIIDRSTRLHGEGYTLTPVSLWGLVYEATPTGRVPIPGISLYCENCGIWVWAVTDANGFYRFSGDLADRGGVWLAPGKPTSLLVVTGDVYEDGPWLSRSVEVLITDDTRLDVEIVRQSARQ